MYFLLIFIIIKEMINRNPNRKIKKAIHIKENSWQHIKAILDLPIHKSTKATHQT
jgi:hypothetical protein